MECWYPDQIQGQAETRRHIDEIHALKQDSGIPGCRAAYQRSSEAQRHRLFSTLPIQVPERGFCWQRIECRKHAQVQANIQTNTVYGAISQGGCLNRKKTHEVSASRSVVLVTY